MDATNNVTISLGQPITVPCLIPVLHASTPNCVSDPFMVNGECYPVTALSFGTPHGAVIVNDVESVDVPSLGSALGTHELFPDGASIVFIQVLDNETVRARLWQRGEGETAFTPEAVCVTATAAMILQKIMMYRANVLMSGNTFQVEWDRIGDVKLTGPANLIQA